MNNGLMKKVFTLIPFLALSLAVGAQEMANIGKTINVISPEVNGTTVTSGSRRPTPAASRSTAR